MLKALSRTRTCASTSANLACFSCNVAIVTSNSACAAASLKQEKNIRKMRVDLSPVAETKHVVKRYSERTQKMLIIILMI